MDRHVQARPEPLVDLTHAPPERNVVPRYESVPEDDEMAVYLTPKEIELALRLLPKQWDQDDEVALYNKIKLQYDLSDRAPSRDY